MKAKGRPRGSKRDNVWVLADLDSTLVLECRSCSAIEVVGSYRSAGDFRGALDAFERRHEHRSSARIAKY